MWVQGNLCTDEAGLHLLPVSPLALLPRSVKAQLGQWGGQLGGLKIRKTNFLPSVRT